MTVCDKLYSRKFTDVQGGNVERASRSFKQAGRMLYVLSPEILEWWTEVHS